MTARTAILVVGLEDGPEACWGPFVLACIDPARFRRIGAVVHHAESGAFRPDVADRVCRIAAPEPDAERFAGSVARLVEEEGIRVVIPGSQAMTDALAHAARAIRKAGAVVCAPALRDLARFTDRGLSAACRGRRLPCVRGRKSVAGGGARTDGVLPDQRFEVALVCEPRGRAVAYAAVRVLATDARLRPWLAVTVADPELRAAGGRVASALRAAGPIVIGFERADAWRAADVRPGFPMWIEAAHAAGVALVDHAVLRATGRTRKKAPAPEAGVLFSQTAEDVPIDLLEPVRFASLGGGA